MRCWTLSVGMQLIVFVPRGWVRTSLRQVSMLRLTRSISLDSCAQLLQILGANSLV